MCFVDRPGADQGACGRGRQASHPGEADSQDGDGNNQFDQ